VNAGFSDADYLKVRHGLRERIYKNKKNIIYKDYYRRTMAGKQTSVPAEKMTYIAEQFEQALDIPASDEADSTVLQPVLLTDAQYLKTGARLADMLDEPFITFDDQSVWTIGDFVAKLRFGPYPLNYTNKALFRTSLRNMAIVMMEQEYMAKEGYARNLHKSSYVQQETRVWNDSFLADRMRMALLSNTVADDEETQRRQRIDSFDNFLSNALDQHQIEIKSAVFDTLQLRHLEMTAFKTHFPGRQAVPYILPLDRMPKFFGELYSYF
jgi:hypothetical protein